MKKLTVSLIAFLGAASVLHAGETTVSTGKDYKQPQQTPVEEPCFKAGEWQFDSFGQYSVGKAGHSGIFRDHGWGGGVGVNYFCTRYFGIGLDAAWLAANEEHRFARHDADDSRTAIHNFSGSVILRLPIDHTCLAPYVYAGGGFHVDGEQWASVHGGVGLEYRIKPNRLGIFVDARWTYLGDREERDDLNFFSARVGFRIVF